MFPTRYFAPRYFAERYWPSGEDGVPATPADDAERYIRPNPTDGQLVAERLRPVLPTD